MKKVRIRLIALALAAAVLLSGCYGLDDYMRVLESYLGSGLATVHFEDMEYTRPDTGTFLECQKACAELARAGEDFNALEEQIWLLFEEYYDFYTQYSLADIHYSADMTDFYWEEEYTWCLEESTEIDAGLDRLCYVLAESPFREELERDDLFGPGYFDDYVGESLWDDTFTAMMEEESALIGAYYELTADLTEEVYGTARYEAMALELADLYAKLIALRQDQAEYAGYDSFSAFAYDFYYDRDYTPAQEAAYLDQIREELVPMYRRVCTDGVDGMEYAEVSEEQTYHYLAEAAANMGGTVAEAFELMEEAGLYDITYGENKYNASFEVYLMNYYEPYIFMNPSGTSYDQLTFAHEFGHFCNDYASWGSMLGIDSMEVFSQGMEYLSLCYVEGTEGLAKLKMMDSLCVYVEQAAYAAFEQEAYSLSGAALTGENLMALYETVMDRFGMDIWEVEGLEFVTIPHYFTSPMYIFSYVVSNDAALQLYQMELAEAGAGLQVFEDNLDSAEPGFLAFLESAGLESPFAQGRLAEVEATFADILG